LMDRRSVVLIGVLARVGIADPRDSFGQLTLVRLDGLMRTAPCFVTFLLGDSRRMLRVDSLLGQGSRRTGPVWLPRSLRNRRCPRMISRLVPWVPR
jgi:hypothetical protein